MEGEPSDRNSTATADDALDLLDVLMATKLLARA